MDRDHYMLRPQCTLRTLRILCLAGLAGMAATPAALANGGIVKCIGAGGHVTLTDTACPAGERSVTLLPGAQSAAPTEAQPLPSAARSLAAPARAAIARAPLARLDPPSRSLTRDVATLKAARQAMLLMDGTAGSLDRRVAGLR